MITNRELDLNETNLTQVNLYEDGIPTDAPKQLRLMDENLSLNQVG